ncbi:MAG TPA: MarR family transcriptional regulator [Polyangiales bacterium]|nr:MarR family transcriptional regulator [Polyangiales bacterium]
MSTRPEARPLAGLSAEDADALGPERAAQVRSFRLILMIAQQLRYLTDQLYRADGLTTQQATLLSVVRALGQPSLSEAAASMLTSHQNAKQLVTSLVGKGFLRLTADREDARVKRLQTTPKNERHWAARDPHDFQRVGEWFGTLSTEEARQLCDLLAKLQRGLKEPVRAARAT